MTDVPEREPQPCWRQIGLEGDASCPELRRHVHCRNCPSHAAAATALLDRAPPEGYLDELTGHVARGSARTAVSMDFAAPAAGAARAGHSAMIFRLGDEWLALPTRLLQEVVELRPVHSLPNRRSSVVLGVTNIHGNLLICVSLAILLGLPPQPEARPGRPGAARGRLLVIGRDPDRFVFPVEEVHGIHRHDDAALRPAPSTIARGGSSHARQVLSWQGRTVGCLDAEFLLDSLNRSVA
jgi:chemotaxis-related protein WspD